MKEQEERAHNFKDLTGIKVGRLFVVKLEEVVDTQSYWLCLCDCGVYRSVNGHSLRHQRVMSCGCLAEERKQARMKPRKSNYE